MFPNTRSDWYYNPGGCWDFGGWGVSDFMGRYATNQGIQTKAIKKMVDRVLSPYQSYTPQQDLFQWEEPTRGGPPPESEGGPPENPEEFNWLTYNWFGLFFTIFINLITNLDFLIVFVRIFSVLPWTALRFAWKIYFEYTFVGLFD